MATQNYFKVKNGLEFPSIETLQTTDNGGPSIKPSLNLDFAKTKALDPRVTFTRASTATYYDGETTALAEQNLVTYSEQVNAWSILQGSVTINAITAPDGTLTGDLFLDNTTNADHYAYTTGPVSAGRTYTASVYVKYNNKQYITVYITNIADTNWPVLVDIQNGIILGYHQGMRSASSNATGYIGSSISHAGNGWYRVTVTAIVTGSNSAGVNVEISNGKLTSNNNYVGTGTGGVYIWGAQLEQRSYATAYTATTTSAITNYVPVLQTATTNTARFDHDPVTGESKGLLIEESRTNLQIYSDRLDNTLHWTTQGASVLATNVTAPNGTSSAFFLRESTSNSYHRVYGSASVTAGVSYTFSVYAKAGSGNRNLYLNLGSTFGETSALFDLSTGAVSNTYNTTSTGATYVGNGWWRCHVTGTSAVTASISTQIWNYASVQATYTGDDRSGNYIWGPQLEAGSFPTSYVPTTTTFSGRGSTATYKAADGLIRTTAANVARYEPNTSGGSNLLLEGAASNLVKDTERINNANWTYGGANTAIIPHAAMAPDGTMSATRIHNVGGDPHIFQAVSVTAGTTYTLSVWIKGVGSSIGSIPYLSFYDGSGWTTGSFTLMPAITGEWVRYTKTFTSTSTSASAQARLDAAEDNPIGSSVYVWGFQFEPGSTATSYIPSVETFTGRSSTATYYDSTGIIRTAASGQPRYTYNPALLSAPPKLLLEATATNLVTQSTGTGWSVYNGIALTLNYSTAPDGTTSAARVVGPGTLRMHTGSLTNGTIYTASMWIKSNTSSTYTFQLQIGDTDVVNVVATPTWQRFTGTGTPAVTGYNFCDLEAVPAGTDISVWGLQLETGYAATSYIPTAGASVTRAADTSTSAVQTRAADTYSSSQVTRAVDLPIISTSSLNTFYRQDEGTFAVEWYDRAQSATHQLFYVYDLSNANNRINLAPNNANVLDGAVVVNGSDYVDSLTPTVTAGYHKAAFAYKVNDSAITMDGASTTSDTACILPNTIQQMNIGIGAGSTQPLNSTMKRLVYYPKRLTNAELVSITA